MITKPELVCGVGCFEPGTSKRRVHRVRSIAITAFGLNGLKPCNALMLQQPRSCNRPNASHQGTSAQQNQTYRRLR